MNEEREIYDITLENDKTLKQFFDRYYVISKDLNCTKEEREFLEKSKLVLMGKQTKIGKNGYIVFRKDNKKITDLEELEEIKKDTRPVRQIAKDHAVSIATISKIKNDKY
ncbi:hypothetical protein ACHM2L_15370 [Clostridium perfringens]|uniref:hypothetical protein n=1 Tax=Clostridium perfringens TaxID=1502 RepID=UPI003754F7D7